MIQPKFYVLPFYILTFVIHALFIREDENNLTITILSLKLSPCWDRRKVKLHVLSYVWFTVLDCLFFSGPQLRTRWPEGSAELLWTKRSARCSREKEFLGPIFSSHGSPVRDPGHCQVRTGDSGQDACSPSSLLQQTAGSHVGTHSQKLP